MANTTTSRWIGPNTPSATGPIGEYTYRTTFTLPNFSKALIVGELSTDDQVTDILINGISAGNPKLLGSWTTVSQFSISRGFVVGINTIEFKVNNIGGPTGLKIHSITGTYTAGFTIADLYNTGVDNARNLLGDSVADSHYTLTSSPAGTVTPAVTTRGNTYPIVPGVWVANTKTSRWIGPNTASAEGPVGNYTYKTTFTLPSFSTASIVGEISVDNNITDILINGVSVGNIAAIRTFTTISKFSISSGFVVGTNTIEFKVYNGGGPTGLLVDSIVGSYSPSLLRAIVYEHRDFQGRSQELSPGSYGIGGFGLANDTLSSLKVDKGLKVTLYEHGNATGRSKTFTADAAWVGDDFNDITSNIKVELVQDIPKEQVLSQKWVQVPNSGPVIDVTVMQDGTILGVNTDNLLYTRANLNSNWVQAPKNGTVIGVTVMKDGTILGVGTDYLLYTRANLNSNWVQAHKHGTVIDVTIMPDGTILGVGTDYLLYTRANLNSNWVQVPNSCCVIGVTVMPNGTILGVGTNNLLYTRANLNSNWVQVPNSCSVIGVTVMPNGTILGIGTDNMLWTKSI